MTRSTYIARALLLATALLIALQGIALATQDPYTEVRISASSLANALVTSYSVSSVQYALLSNGEIVVSGFARAQHKSDTSVLSEQTIYGIGSASKMFSTTAILLLVDEGKVDLDEPVVTYIPEFKMADERYRQITVRMLLNHSSGLMGTVYANSTTYESPNTIYHDFVLSQLSTQRLKADPGQFSVYCNDGFTLADLIVERVSGVSFSEFVRQRIAEPLGMANTKTPQDNFDMSRLARTSRQGEMTPYEMTNAIGAGGIYSTAEDLCKLGQVYMDNPGSEAAANLLSDEMRKASMQPEYLKGIWPEMSEGWFGYGLGWDSVAANFFSKYGVQALSKGGDTELYHSTMIVLPEHNMAFAVVMSGGSSLFGQAMGQSLLAQALLAEGRITEIIAPPDIKPPVPSAMPSELAGYAGIYANNAVVSQIEISANGRLTVSPLSSAGMPRETYYYTSDGEFVSVRGDKRLTFVNESNGLTYTRLVQTLTVPGQGQVMLTGYEMQRTEPNIVDDAEQKAWDARNGTKYYLVNEIPTSPGYASTDYCVFRITTSGRLPGYAGTYRIIDANTAIQDVQIPVLMGRDSVDIEISVIDGKEYLLAAGSIYLRENDMEELRAGESVTYAIEADGHARWFTISEQDAGKTMTVVLPKGGSFAVYDAEDLCVHFSVVKGNQPVQHPANGKVVFVGQSPGDEFVIAVR